MQRIFIGNGDYRRSRQINMAEQVSFFGQRLKVEPHFLQRNFTSLPRTNSSGTPNFALQLVQTTVFGCWVISYCPSK